MGHLVEEGVTGLYTASGAAAPVSSTEITVAISFSLEGGKNEAQVWKSAMMEVVNERNRLIHQMLAGFDPRSRESCEELSAVLDLQRERIVPAYEHLESLVRAIREGHTDLAQRIDETLAVGFTGESPNAA